MRLWHYRLLPALPRQQLLGQHRECCALRGNGWGKPHATVDYVFKHRYDMLYQYHTMVMEEMERRGYTVDQVWYWRHYRGKHIGFDTTEFTKPSPSEKYPEHNDAYLAECIENLAAKGIVLNMATT